MPHPGLKISLMEQNKFKKHLSILITCFLISNCQFNWVEERKIYLNQIEFGLGIENSFKQKAKKFFNQDPSSEHLGLKILNLQFKKRNFYEGSSARAKQIEIIGELKYNFTNTPSNQINTLQVSSWIPVNENNAQAEINAQNKIIEDLEFLLLEYLVEEYWLIES